MRILIEGHEYEAAKVRDVLHGIDALEDADSNVNVNYVGYFFNTLLKDCVFILPKVLLEGETSAEEKVFGEYKPEDIIDPEKNHLLAPEQKRFIYEFAVWIYRTIVEFKRRNPKSGIIYQKRVTQAGKGRRHKTDTFLDVVLALIRFNQENQNFFFFVLRNLHSGYNKINWTRTISKSTAIIQDNRPVYLNPVNKKRQINFDEELLVIFFSILNYLNKKYGFTAQINCNFDLVEGKQFDAYIEKGLGRTRLLQIKYKYFSDKALELWELCYAFFDHARHVHINTNQQEYLLAKNFNIVFEAMIDELIGDNPLPDGMDKRQEDGKIVDHLFKDRSLIENKDKFTYYIGDSKYYKIGHELGPESVYKQYTYARNVIQWNLDIFNSGKTPESGVKLRDDELTEGYNIIPNFFISAKMDKSFDYKNDGVEKTDRRKNKHTQLHFHNRLFDRDTLLLFHYDVNFLFIVSLYARNNALQKAAWKEKMRGIFRREIRERLQEEFNFYAMQPLPGNNAETYIREHFRDVLGKVYTPYADNNILSLALASEGFEAENERLLEELRQHFYVEECKLGEDPSDKLPAIPSTIYVDAGKSREELVLCVMIQNEKQFEKAAEDVKLLGRFGIALKESNDMLRLVEGFTKAKYLILLNKGEEYHAFLMTAKGPYLLAHPPKEAYKLPNNDDNALWYLVFEVVKERDLKFKNFTPSLLGKGRNAEKSSTRLLNIGQLIAPAEQQPQEQQRV